MHEKFVGILDSNVPEFPKVVELKLPPIKKMEFPTLQTTENQ
jgi:hypothetical protein